MKKSFGRKCWPEFLVTSIAFMMLLGIPLTYRPLRESLMCTIENDITTFLGWIASMLLVFTLIALPWEKWYKEFEG